MKDRTSQDRGRIAKELTSERGRSREERRRGEDKEKGEHQGGTESLA